MIGGSVARRVSEVRLRGAENGPEPLRPEPLSVKPRFPTMAPRLEAFPQSFCPVRRMAPEEAGSAFDWLDLVSLSKKPLVNLGREKLSGGFNSAILGWER